MKTLIVYDSVFGNTQKLAEAMAGMPDASAVRVADIKAEMLKEAGLLLVGSPTRAFKPTSAITEWLKSLPEGALSGVRAAAFDSRVSPEDVKSGALKLMMKKFGYAAPDIEKLLTKKGAEIAAPPKGFFVRESEGPLADGEEGRAAEWARKLV